ncbi:MAG: putative transcriptional regulator of viral defense system [Chlamydiales bacterium]|jgi:predicted transcriptional regulator of viral defense system
MHSLDKNECILYNIDMETRSKYLPQLAAILEQPLILAKEAEKYGVTRQALAYLCKLGLLERLSDGIYQSVDYEPEVDVAWEQLAIQASIIPNAVICLISALAYYELTDEIPRENWIAIPNVQRAPVRKGLRVVRMRNIELGQLGLQLGEYKVKIYDRERCVVDAFRYLSIEIAIKALRAYIRDSNKRPTIKKITDYAKELRVHITPYILSETT